MPTDTSETSEVTFVAGHAVEQTEGLDSNLEEEEREAAKEAVRKAIRGESEDIGKEAAKKAKEAKNKSPFKPEGMKVDDEAEGNTEPKHSKGASGSDGPERGPDGKFVPKEGSASSPKTGKASDAAEKESETEEIDFDKASVKQLLKAREKVAALKREGVNAKNEYVRQQAENARAQEEIQAQWQQVRQQQAEMQRQARAFQALRNDPARAIRENGLDPEQFILDLASDGTPEGQARRQQKEIADQLAEIRQWKQDQARQQLEWQQRQQEHHQRTERENLVKSFVRMGADEQKYPHTAAFYKGMDRVLVAAGDIAAQEYRQLSGGKEGSLEDILDYIEDSLAERANSWYQSRSSNTKTQVVSDYGDVSRPKSKGKSLSPDGSGERRTLAPKSLKDLDGDERLEAARRSVRVALANSE